MEIIGGSGEYETPAGATAKDNAVKLELQGAIDLKQDIIAGGTFATPGEVDDAVQAIVGMSPADLNTLAEIAARIIAGEDDVAAIAGQIATKQDIIEPGTYETPAGATAKVSALAALKQDTIAPGTYSTPAQVSAAIAALAALKQDVIPGGTFATPDEVSSAIDDLAALKQDIIAPGAYATPADVSDAVEAIINMSPADLDTLAEIAARIIAGEDDIAAIASQIASKQDIIEPGTYATPAQLDAAIDDLAALKQDVIAPGTYVTPVEVDSAVETAIDTLNLAPKKFGEVVYVMDGISITPEDGLIKADGNIKYGYNYTFDPDFIDAVRFQGEFYRNFNVIKNDIEAYTQTPLVRTAIESISNTSMNGGKFVAYGTWNGVKSIKETGGYNAWEDMAHPGISATTSRVLFAQANPGTMYSELYTLVFDESGDCQLYRHNGGPSWSNIYPSGSDITLVDWTNPIPPFIHGMAVNTNGKVVIYGGGVNNGSNGENYIVVLSDDYTAFERVPSPGAANAILSVAFGNDGVNEYAVLGSQSGLIYKLNMQTYALTVTADFFSPYVPTYAVVNDTVRGQILAFSGEAGGSVVRRSTDHGETWFSDIDPVSQGLYIYEAVFNASTGDLIVYGFNDQGPNLGILDGTGAQDAWKLASTKYNEITDLAIGIGYAQNAMFINSTNNYAVLAESYYLDPGSFIPAKIEAQDGLTAYIYTGPYTRV